MRSVNFWAFLIFTILIGLFQSCEKDPIPEPINVDDEQIESSSFLDYDWNPIEQQFFSLRNTGSIEVVDFRNTNTKQIFRPELLKVYAEIARQNEVYNFAEDIFMKAGSPLWSQAKVTEYTGSARVLVMIPVQYQSQQKVSAVISVAIEDYGTDNEYYIIDALSREEVLQDDTDYPEQKEAYASWLINFEKEYFGNESNTVLKEKYCELKNGGDNLPPNPCEWVLFTICTDDETQTTWRAGVDILPPHLDHDGDGILNNEDQDWQELLRRFGTNDQDLVNRIRDYWNGTYSSRYGDYDSFWYDDDGGFGIWDYDDGWLDSGFDGGTPISFEDIWSDISGFFDWIADTFGGDRYIGPNQDYDASDMDCPFPLLPNETVSFRNTNCQSIYVRYCNGVEQDPNWWRFMDWITCVSCSDQDLENTERRMQMLIGDYIDLYGLTDWQSLIAELAAGGPVNASRKDFFDYLNQRLLYYFAEAHQDYEEFRLPVPLQEWLVEYPGLIGALLMESSVTGQGQTSPGDLTSLMNLIFDLDQQWGLSESELIYLAQNPYLTEQVTQYLEDGRFDSSELSYALWAVDKFGGDLSYYLAMIDEFNEELDEPFVYEDNSGIEILERYVPDEAPENYSYFGETPYRAGHEYNPPLVLPEDMQSGTDGDVNLLSYREGFYGITTYHEPSGNRLLDDKTDDELFDILNSRLQSDLLNRDLKNVATEYLSRFRASTGGDYFNEELSEYTLENSHTEATVKDFGNWLNEKLKDVNGDLSAIDDEVINDPANGLTEAYRAIFNTGEMTSGLKILINDTEKLAVYPMGDYTHNPITGEWSGSFYFVIYDNFGLDNQDLIDFQGKFFAGEGFAAWWILQHRRGYQPFRTEIRNAFKLQGQYEINP